MNPSKYVGLTKYFIYSNPIGWYIIRQLKSVSIFSSSLVVMAIFLVLQNPKNHVLVCSMLYIYVKVIVKYPLIESFT